ncbi:hypothetical protein ACVIW0_006954 [Bradyrhizobium sp. USDA 4454]
MKKHDEGSSKRRAFKRGFLHSRKMFSAGHPTWKAISGMS